MRRRPAACGPTRSSWRTSRELNPQLKHTQFADFHGHGWVLSLAAVIVGFCSWGDYLDDQAGIQQRVTPFIKERAIAVNRHDIGVGE